MNRFDFILIKIRIFFTHKNFYPNLILLSPTNSYVGTSKLVGAGPFLILPELS
jgi:hypothetical protein